MKKNCMKHAAQSQVLKRFYFFEERFYSVADAK